MLYFKYLLADLLKRKFIVLAVVLIGAAAGVFIACRGSGAVSTEAESAEIKDYYDRLEGYENAVRLAEESVAEQEKAVKNLQTYVDNSILMRIDASSVKASTIQYSITYEAGVDAGKVNQGILTYITDGGLKENIENAEELETAYWGEVLTASINGSTLNLCFNHYDAEKGKAILELICRRLEERAPEIAEVQGAFTLKELDRTFLERADNNIMNTKTNKHAELKNQKKALADLENYLISCRKNLANHIADNAPDGLALQKERQEEGTAFLFRYGLMGALAGLVLCVAVLLLIYVADDRIRNAGTLKGTAFNVLGTVKAGRFRPEAERILMDADMLRKNAGKAGIFVYRESGSEEACKTAAGLAETLTGKEVPALSGSHLFESADELSKLVSAGALLYVAVAGRTSLHDLEKIRQLCDRYQVAFTGIVVLE